MADSQLDQFSLFLQEATDPVSDACVGRECLYGLYISWCLLSQQTPSPEETFWAAMKKRNIHPGRTGLRIKGPAAADYILSSYPAVV
jgi:hypothetical protein